MLNGTKMEITIINILWQHSEKSFDLIEDMRLTNLNVF